MVLAWALALAWDRAWVMVLVLVLGGSREIHLPQLLQLHSTRLLKQPSSAGDTLTGRLGQRMLGNLCRLESANGNSISFNFSSATIALSFVWYFDISWIIFSKYLSLFGKLLLVFLFTYLQ